MAVVSGLYREWALRADAYVRERYSEMSLSGNDLVGHLFPDNSCYHSSP